MNVVAFPPLVTQMMKMSEPLEHTLVDATRCRRNVNALLALIDGETIETERWGTVWTGPEPFVLTTTMTTQNMDDFSHSDAIGVLPESPPIDVPTQSRRIVFGVNGTIDAADAIAMICRLRLPGGARSLFQELERFTARWHAFRPYLTADPEALVQTVIDETTDIDGISLQLIWYPLPTVALTFSVHSRPTIYIYIYIYL